MERIIKTAVAYYRVSKNEQDNERQIKDVEEYCKVNNIQIIKNSKGEDFQEKISGAKRKRPELMELMRFVESNRVDYVIVSELSRFGRQTTEVLNLVEKLDSLNICLVCLKENIKTLDPNPSIQANSLLILRIWAGLVSYELETIKYRIKSGRDNKVINHGSCGGSNRYNYGYKSMDKRLVINEVEAETVKLMFDRANDGWGSTKIGNYLNNEHIPTRSQLINKNPKPWTRITINQILRNKIYIGQRPWQGEILNVPDLRIISDHTFNAVQKKLKGRQTSSSDFKRKYSYLFDRKIIRCGRCGQPYFGVFRNNMYKCSSGMFSGGCGNPSVKIDFIEPSVINEIVKNYLNVLLTTVESVNVSKGFEANLSLQKQELTKQLQKIERIKELYLEGSYSKVEYQLKIDSTTELINRINLNIESLEEQIAETDSEKEITTLLEKLYIWHSDGYLNESTFTIPKEILRKIVTSIVINESSINVSLIRGLEFTMQR
jgi:site-specific DNA recombinase